MKSNNRLTVFIMLGIIILGFSIDNSFPQEAFKPLKIGKVILKSGEVITARKIQAGDSQILVSPMISSEKDKMFQYADIDKILVPTKNHGSTGFICGTVFGGIAALIFKSFYNEDVITGWHVENHYGITGMLFSHKETPIIWEKRMSTGVVVGIVVGGALLGTIIGALIPGGWIEVYPAESDRISLNMENTFSKDTPIVIFKLIL